MTQVEALPPHLGIYIPAPLLLPSGQVLGAPTGRPNQKPELKEAWLHSTSGHGALWPQFLHLTVAVIYWPQWLAGSSEAVLTGGYGALWKKVPLGSKAALCLPPTPGALALAQCPANGRGSITVPAWLPLTDSQRPYHDSQTLQPSVPALPSPPNTHTPSSPQPPGHPQTDHTPTSGPWPLQLLLAGPITPDVHVACPLASSTNGASWVLPSLAIPPES